MNDYVSGPGTVSGFHHENEIVIADDNSLTLRIVRILVYFLLFFLSLGIHARQSEATSRLDFLWKMQANGKKVGKSYQITTA
jgi:hypothetical protein